MINARKYAVAAGSNFARLRSCSLAIALPITLTALLTVSSNAHAVLGTTGVNGMQVFAASGTWTAPTVLLGDQITHAQVLLCGGGGGGSSQIGTVSPGANGGAVVAVVPVIPGQTYTVSVGAGGQPGQSFSDPIRDAGDSSFATSSGVVLAVATGARLTGDGSGHFIPGAGSISSSASGVVLTGSTTPAANSPCQNWIAPFDSGLGSGGGNTGGGAGYAIVFW